MFSKNFNPDVRFFKTALADVRVARGLMQQILPEDLQVALDMNTLKHLPNCFEIEDLADTITDVVYSVQFNTGKLAYIGLILGHQSTPDYLLSPLMFYYTSQIYEQYHKQHPNEKLPFVYSLVVYNGQHSSQNVTQTCNDSNVAQTFANLGFSGPPQFIDISEVDSFIKKNYD